MGSLFSPTKTTTDDELSDGNHAKQIQSPSYILHPDLRQPNPRIVAARGNYLFLDNGRQILDASGGPAVTCIGHGNVDVKNAVARQMESLSFCHGLSWSNTAAEELAKAVVSSTNGVMDRCTILGSGTLWARSALDRILRCTSGGQAQKP